jgi:hypothetical protein
MVNKIILIACTLILTLNIAKADSPLTSTEFYKAYQDIPEVQEAIKAQGRLTPQLLKYLSDTSQRLEYKLAVINALGWEKCSKQDAQLFRDYVLEQRFGNEFRQIMMHRLDAIEKFRSGRADDLICYSYMSAMENYSNPSQWYSYADIAISRKPNSVCTEIIAALIRAQVLNDIYMYCDGYKGLQNLRNSNSLIQDMRIGAFELILKESYYSPPTDCK